jgi:hypothetical protein
MLTLHDLVQLLVQREDKVRLLDAFPPSLLADIRAFLDTLPTTEQGWDDWARRQLLSLHDWDDSEAEDEPRSDFRVERSVRYRRGVEAVREYFARG